MPTEKRILVTGGAGFIGSHLCRKLLREDWTVTVLDNLSPQVHGRNPTLDLPPEVELIIGDVRNRDTVAAALKGQVAVVHLAAETGTGQSMYELVHYEQVNVHGTALLMDEISRQPPGSIQKIVVASSRAVYGEGAYRCDEHDTVYPRSRESRDMLRGEFGLRCPHCREFCESIPTDESCPFSPGSFYGVTKQVQEQTVLMFGKAFGIPSVALRYQNVYGPGQSLKNPYTGILAVFTNLARENKPISIFEDGRESRDFVYIDDVVEATWRCIEFPIPTDAYNVGSGKSVTVKQVAEAVVTHCKSRSKIEVSGAFRAGDIRHNVADLHQARRLIGFEPMWSFSDGVEQFVNWAVSHEPDDNGFEASMEELRSRGLLQGASLK